MYAILPLTVSEWSEDATTTSCPPATTDYLPPLSLPQPLPASDHVTSWTSSGDATEKILLAIYRDRLDVAWGFRIQGGREFGTPLVVQKVFPGTPADGQLLEGDVIHFIDGHAASDLIHNRALEIIKNATGYLNFTIERKLGFKPAQPMPVFTHYNTPVSNNFASPQPDVKTGKRTILRREVEKVEKLENSIIFKPIYDTLPWPKDQHGLEQQQQHQQPAESQVSTDVYKRPVGKVVVKRGSSAKFREKPVDRLYRVSDNLEGVPTGLQHPGWVPKAKTSPKTAPVDPPKQLYKSMAEKLDDPNYLPNLLHREPSPELNKPAPRRQIIADFAEVKKEEDLPAWLGSLRSTGALLPFEKKAEFLHGSEPDPDFRYESVHQRIDESQTKKFGGWESTEYGVETSEAKEYPADHVKSTENHPKDSSTEVKHENQEVGPGLPLQSGIEPEATVEHAETTNVLEARPDVPSGEVVAEEIKQEVPVACESEGVKREPTAAAPEPAGSSGPEKVPEAKIEQHAVPETEKSPETKPEQPAAAKPDVIPETKQEHAVVSEPEKVSEIKQEQASAPEAEKVKQEQPAASEPGKVPEPKPEPAAVSEPEKVPETKQEEAVAPEPEKGPEPKPEPVAATEPEKVPEPKPEPASATEPEKVPETKQEEVVAPAEPEKVSEPKPEPVAAMEPEKLPETKQEETVVPAPETVPESNPEQATVPEPEKVPETQKVVAPEPEKAPEQTGPTEHEKVPETKEEQTAAPEPENVPEPKPEQATAPKPENVSEPKPEQAAAPTENESSKASQDNQEQSSTSETGSGEVKQDP